MGEDRTGRPGPDERSVTVAEAAVALGISPEAVRMRIKRGTLRSEKRGSRVYLLLGPRPTTEQTTEQTPDHTAELIATLREQLQAERQAHAEARRLLMAALEKIPPAMEAPPEPQESPGTATPQPGRVEPRPAVESMEAQESPEMAMPEAGGGPQHPHSERPWWRRMFGA